MQPKPISREILFHLYVTEGLGYPEIAKQLDCSIANVANYARINGINKNLRFIGREFGKLKVVSNAGHDEGGRTKWSCICQCGNTIDVVGYNLLHGNTKTCGCSRTTKGTQHPAFKGYQEISGQLWNTWKSEARQRNIPFEITIEYAWNLFEQQNRKCALTDLDIVFAQSNSKDDHGERTASLDRIDSSQGYKIGNVQWLHKHINIMKLDHQQIEFIRLCKLVAEKNQ